MFRRLALAAAVSVLTAAPLAFASCNTPEPGRFTANGEEVYDSKTGLTWQRCSIGQTWQQDKCAGSVQALTWDQAKKRAGGKWRLPTREELESLTDTPCGTSEEVKKLFPDMDPLYPMYWSATSPDNGLAWLVGFNNGSTFNGFRTAPNGVRLVRTGK